MIFAGAGAVATQVCKFDPTSGEPNPLGGIKTFLSIKERRDISGAIQTSVILERLPADLPSITSPGELVTLSETAELLFSGMKVDQVRKTMLRNPSYYRELTGDKDPKGFAKVNESLSCRESSLKEADVDLNNYYRETLDRLDGKNKKLLIGAQWAWLLLRDNSCLLERGLVLGDKFSEPVYHACMSRLTEFRTKELIQIYYGAPAK